MARVTAEKALQTRVGILEAARQVLQDQGFAGLSTRNVALAAGVPMSQIQYHFGSKDGMLLALYEYLNAQLLERQNPARSWVICSGLPAGDSRWTSSATRPPAIVGVCSQPNISCSLTASTGGDCM